LGQDRAIRFAIPPFFLFASLLWGAYLGHRDLSFFLRPEIAKELLGLLAAAAVVVVPLGFLISVISVTALRLLALIFGIQTYEAKLDGPTLDRIWTQLQSSQPRNERLTLYAATTFDHEILDDGIHQWLLRRWNSFNVAAHSIVALLLAQLVFGPIFSIPQSWKWYLSTAVLLVLLLIQASHAWHEVMKMIEFQSHRQQRNEHP
jgi:hypothetical protein